MRFYDWAIQQMTIRGMISQGAMEVMNGIIKDRDFAVGTMMGRWSEHVDDYPPMGLDLVWENIREVALVYLQEKHPAFVTMPLFVNSHNNEAFESDIRKWRNAQREVFQNSEKFEDDGDFILDLKRRFFPHLVVYGPSTCM